MEQDCRQCALGVAAADDRRLIRCYATGRLVAPEKQLHQWQCLYYMEPVIEDGQPLSVEQHYILKQAELDNKK
ncbi:MAG: hypothetical protein K6T29_04630 [Peptococcaceae bacterium]|nr:hypothetical protein [Peptococcaceae bacterium]